MRMQERAVCRYIEQRVGMQLRRATIIGSQATVRQAGTDSGLPARSGQTDEHEQLSNTGTDNG